MDGYAGVCSVTFGGDGVCSEKSGDYNLFFFLAFLSLWIMRGLMVRRLHDLNLRGWWMLLIVPLVVLPFWPGKRGRIALMSKQKMC